MVFDPSGGLPTFANLLKNLDPTGKLSAVGQLLSQSNEILDDMPFYEANEIFSHRITVDATLPEGTWRRVNKGVAPSEGDEAQVTETIAMLEARSGVDVVLARVSGDIAGFRLRKARKKLEGLSQQLATSVIYGDTVVNPDRIYGIIPRYPSLGNPTNALTANTMGMDHVLDGGGTTADVQSSIILAGWGEGKVYGIYPRGSTAGIEQQDLGEGDLFDADGNKFRGYETLFRVQQGLAIEDWRYIVRIANVEVGVTLDADKINALVGVMIDAKNAIPSLGSCRPVFYMNRACRSLLEKAVVQKANMALSISEVYGMKNVLNLFGIPIKQTDALVSTEDVVS